MPRQNRRSCALYVTESVLAKATYSKLFSLKEATKSALNQLFASQWNLHASCVRTFQQKVRQLKGGTKAITRRKGSSSVMEGVRRREGREARGETWREEEAGARPRGREKGFRRQEVALGRR